LTGLVTDIGNICGQACRKNSNAETWRLKIHIPIFFGFLFGGFCGSVSWIVLHEYSMLLPAMLTGISSLLYFSLPVFKESQVILSDTNSIDDQMEIPATSLTCPNSEQFNYREESYRKELRGEFDSFLADIDQRNSDNVKSHKNRSISSFTETDLLLD
jgi:hypothetical protein